MANLTPRGVYEASRFWAGNFSRISPDMEAASIASVDVSELKNLGIRGIIFDVDNTLTRYHGKSLDSAIEQNFRRMSAEFKTCIISNSTRERRDALEGYFGIPVVKCPVKKPHPDAFNYALNLLGTSASETAMIGDRLLTDIAGANRAGLYSIKVPALHPRSEPPNIMAARLFEQVALRIYSLK